MTSPLKSSDSNPPLSPSPLVEICLKCEPPSNRRSLIATTTQLPSPLMERNSCYIRKSLQGNIPSASSNDINVYSTNSSDDKI